jgi:hypothetical protein
MTIFMEDKFLWHNANKVTARIKPSNLHVKRECFLNSYARVAQKPLGIFCLLSKKLNFCIFILYLIFFKLVALESSDPKLYNDIKFDIGFNLLRDEKPLSGTIFGIYKFCQPIIWYVSVLVRGERVPL